MSFTAEQLARSMAAMLHVDEAEALRFVRAHRDPDAGPTMPRLERLVLLDQGRKLIEMGSEHLIVMKGRNPTINRLAKFLTKVEARRKFREYMTTQAQERMDVDLGAEDTRFAGRRVELVDERGNPI